MPDQEEAFTKLCVDNQGTEHGPEFKEAFDKHAEPFKPKPVESLFLLEMAHGKLMVELEANFQKLLKFAVERE
jgi:hypothetical protein